MGDPSTANGADHGARFIAFFPQTINGTGLRFLYNESHKFYYANNVFLCYMHTFGNY